MRATVALACAVACATLYAAGAAVSQTAGPGAEDALMQSRRISYQLRAGRYDLAPQSVTLLEAAVQKAPGDARLWNALGTAYFQQLTADFRSGTLANIPTLLQKATAAHAKALAIAPDDPDGLSGHGAGLAIAAGFTGRADMGRQGIAELDRAVALAPNSHLARLQRGFTHLGVADNLRNTPAAEADLKYLARLTEGSRSADVLHVMLGDLAFDAGKAEEARAQYAIAARERSAVREMGAARLASLASGGPARADVAALRGAPGRDCGLCHGS